jgi:hypothetical protein
MESRLSDFVITGVSTVVAPPLAALGASPGEGITPSAWSGRPARLPRMDRLCALALVAADGAVINAGLPPQALEGPRTAVVFGTAFGCHATNEAYYRDLLSGGSRAASPRLFAYTLPSSPVGEICIHFQITGPASTRAGGLTSGLEALIEGQRLLRRPPSGSTNDSIDRVLVVAADVATPWLMKILGRTDLEDSAVALLLERREAAGDRNFVWAGYLIGFGTAFSSHRQARKVAIADAFAMAAMPKARVARSPADVTRLYTFPSDGFEFDLSPQKWGSYRSGLLATAPLHHLGHFLRNETGMALLAVSDPEGAAAAALVARSLPTEGPPSE